MRITKSASGENSGGLFNSAVTDIIGRVFQISLIPTIVLTAWLLWGLFSGRLADLAHATQQERHDAINTIYTFSGYLSLSLVVTVVSGALLYWDLESLGVIYLLAAAVLAYGVRLAIDVIFSADASRMTSGDFAKAGLSEIVEMSKIFGVPGILLAVKEIFSRIMNNHGAQDLASVQYGKGVKQETRRAPLIGALARCWELPFCRESIRAKCPIFHAKTKCWKQRVGCMCEENIIVIAMSDAPHPDKTVALNAQSGFVPIGDLIAKSADTKRAAMSMRKGPRGVMIPSNPHITPAQARERCRNCIIYNEHQRHKYQLFSGPITLAVPLLVFLQFDNLRGFVDKFLGGFDRLVSHITFDPSKASDLSRSISSNLPVETILIVCLTMVLMTWAQRILEYCIYDIKI